MVVRHAQRQAYSAPLRVAAGKGIGKASSAEAATWQSRPGPGGGSVVTGGLQGEELGVDGSGNADPARLAALCAAAGELPAAALPVLRW